MRQTSLLVWVALVLTALPSAANARNSHSWHFHLDGGAGAGTDPQLFTESVGVWSVAVGASHDVTPALRFALDGSYGRLAPSVPEVSIPEVHTLSDASSLVAGMIGLEIHAPAHATKGLFLQGSVGPGRLSVGDQHVSVLTTTVHDYVIVGDRQARLAFSVAGGFHVEPGARVSLCYIEMPGGTRGTRVVALLLGVGL